MNTLPMIIEPLEREDYFYSTLEIQGRETTTIHTLSIHELRILKHLAGIAIRYAETRAKKQETSLPSVTRYGGIKL